MRPVVSGDGVPVVSVLPDETKPGSEMLRVVIFCERAEHFVSDENLRVGAIDTTHDATVAVERRRVDEFSVMIGARVQRIAHFDRFVG